MDARQCDQVAMVYAQLGEYYGRPLSDQVIRFYVTDLADLPLRDVLWALHAMRREPGRRTCPLPADVRHRAGVVGETAEEMAGRICGSVARVGRYNIARAREVIGEVGWSVVVTFGGWGVLCEVLTIDNLGTIRAQVRELCRAQMGRAAHQRTDHALPPPMDARQLDLPQRAVAIRRPGA